MLKLTYTENSFNLDYLNIPLENWVNQRVNLALTTGTNIYMEPSTAAFLLPTESSLLAILEKLAQANLIEFCFCDSSWLEVTLKGIWITSTANSETGVFLTNLTPSVELLLQQLSQKQQLCHA
ncbi:MAG: hypothetical protein IGS49_13060 [Chlorogloeopsis fritschii C42_A2020_084]|uniref:alr0857 family protein n=1 Tax=Chlorogloeopsis fritschii TaxID=1124 RepID=UPI0019E1ED73|nr:alr0857 family protein [Chlorogloeopsis fritschii]MBF2006357.1 hypothetical protein [Chlorogloeopsis fritschii C42_A2020_084]